MLTELHHIVNNYWCLVVIVTFIRAMHGNLLWLVAFLWNFHLVVTPSILSRHLPLCIVKSNSTKWESSVWDWIVCVGFWAIVNRGQYQVDGHAFDVSLTTTVPAITLSFFTSFWETWVIILWRKILGTKCKVVNITAEFNWAISLRELKNGTIAHKVLT